MTPSGSDAMVSSGGRALPQRLRAAYSTRPKQGEDSILCRITIDTVVDIRLDHHLTPTVQRQFCVMFGNVARRHKSDILPHAAIYRLCHHIRAPRCWIERQAWREPQCAWNWQTLAC